MHQNSDSDILKELTEAARGNTEVAAKVALLEKEVITLRQDFAQARAVNAREFEAVRDTFGSRLDSLALQMGHLEGEVQTTNSHLDNLVRATEITNELLREESSTRKDEREHLRLVESEDREWKRKLVDRNLDREDDRREFLQKRVDELWATSKTPIAFLFGGIVFWFLSSYLGVPASLLARLFQ